MTVWSDVKVNIVRIVCVQCISENLLRSLKEQDQISAPNRISQTMCWFEQTRFVVVVNAGNVFLKLFTTKGL